MGVTQLQNEFSLVWGDPLRRGKLAFSSERTQGIATARQEQSAAARLTLQIKGGHGSHCFEMSTIFFVRNGRKETFAFLIGYDGWLLRCVPLRDRSQG